MQARGGAAANAADGIGQMWLCQLEQQVHVTDSEDEWGEMPDVMSDSDCEQSSAGVLQQQQTIEVQLAPGAVVQHAPGAVAQQHAALEEVQLAPGAMVRLAPVAMVQQLPGEVVQPYAALDDNSGDNGLSKPGD